MDEINGAYDDVNQEYLFANKIIFRALLNLSCNRICARYKAKKIAVFHPDVKKDRKEVASMRYLLCGTKTLSNSME